MGLELMPPISDVCALELCIHGTAAASAPQAAAVSNSGRQRVETLCMKVPPKKVSRFSSVRCLAHLAVALAGLMPDAKSSFLAPTLLRRNQL
jgi:hypothetical protein